MKYMIFTINSIKDNFIENIYDETISQLEDPDYGGYSLRTLQRLASAFDVHLSVRFEPFSRLVEYITNLEQSDLAVPGFDDDQGLAIGHTVDAVTEMATPIQLVVHSDIPLIHINAPVQIIEAGTVTKEQYSKVAPLYHQIAEDTTIGQYAYADAGGG